MMSGLQGRFAKLPMWAIGVATISLIAIATVVVFSGLYRNALKPGGETLTADFTKSGQIRTGDQVRMEGEVKGEVKKIEPSPDGEMARIEFEVNDPGPIYADAQARLRFKTLLGAAYYLELDRGTESAGPLESDLITSDRTNVQVELEDLTGIWRDGAVPGFQTLPGELATALADPEQLPRVFRETDAVANSAKVTLNALRGTDQDEDLKRLVRETAKTVDALDSDAENVKTLVSGAAKTLEVTGRRGPEIREAIEQGPEVTDHLQTTLARLDGTLDITRGLVSRLQPAAPRVGPTLSKLNPTLSETAGLLNEAQPLLRVLRPTSTSLAGAGRSGSQLLDGLVPSLERTDETIIPYFARKDPHSGYSTTVMVGGTASSLLVGVSAQQDGNGHFIRFPASAGASSAYLPCTSNLIDPNTASLLACDRLDDALREYFEYTGAGQQLLKEPTP